MTREEEQSAHINSLLRQIDGLHKEVDKLAERASRQHQWIEAASQAMEQCSAELETYYGLYHEEFVSSPVKEKPGALLVAQLLLEGKP